MLFVKINMTSVVSADNVPCQTRGVFVAGWGSGAGKSTVCALLLHLLLKRGFAPQELSYIKPVTQCEAETDVVRYCAQRGIAHRGVGPVVFRSGFTKEVLAAQDYLSRRDALLCEVIESVREISFGRKWVIVDGVGYPGVGSCCGVSNGAVAAALRLPVLLVCPGGVGDCIDTFETMAATFERHGARVAAAVCNRVQDSRRHTAEECRTFVQKYLAEVRPSLLVLGFIPPALDPPSAGEAAAEEDLPTRMCDQFAPFIAEDALSRLLGSDL